MKMGFTRQQRAKVGPPFNAERLKRKAVWHAISKTLVLISKTDSRALHATAAVSSLPESKMEISSNKYMYTGEGKVEIQTFISNCTLPHGLFRYGIVKLAPLEHH